MADVMMIDLKALLVEREDCDAGTMTRVREALAQRGDLDKARTLLDKLGDLGTHNAEYHFQLASIHLAQGDRDKAVKHLERAIDLDPSHTGALFQLGHANDLAGNDDDAIVYYERC